MRAGDAVLYIENPETVHPALVLGVVQPDPHQPPVLSLVYVPKADPRLEGNDWHTAVVRKGGVLHGTHDDKAGKGLYDCWAVDIDDAETIQGIHHLRRQDQQALAAEPEAPLTSGPALVAGQQPQDEENEE